MAKLIEYKYSIIFTFLGISILTALIWASFNWVGFIKDATEESGGSVGALAPASGFQFEKLKKIGIITENVSPINTSSSEAIVSSTISSATATKSFATSTNVHR